MPEQEWWKGASTHIWRTFFRFKMDGRQPDTQPKKKVFGYCETAFSQMTDEEKSFITEFFSCPWGTEKEFVMEYSSKTGIKQYALWKSVHNANRRIFELAGLLESELIVNTHIRD